MSMNCLVAHKSMRVFIDIGMLLSTAWTHSGIPVPLQSVVECTRMGVGSEGWYGVFQA